jgi:hypothetical protein
MTEAEWLESSRVWPMLDHVQVWARSRRMRLFACGCCRMVKHLIEDPRIWAAVETAEHFADGDSTVDALNDAANDANSLYPEILSAPHRYAARAAYKASEHGTEVWQVKGAWADVTLALEGSALIAATPQEDVDTALENWQEAHLGSGRALGCTEADPERVIASLLRCVVGNPFLPVTFNPAWRTDTTVALAAGIYSDHAFDRLPIFADALEEAGCDHADTLAHCRGPGPHARGCWVVDGVLGKS